MNYLTLSAPPPRRRHRRWRLQLSRAGIAATIIFILMLLWLVIT